MFGRAIYDDLLQRLGSANDILKTLIDHSTHKEESHTKRNPWAYLLKRYRKVRSQAEGLFHAVVEGDNWPCCCKDQHRVQLKLSTNPLKKSKADREISDAENHFQIVFSTSLKAEETSAWTWTEVIMEPYSAEITPAVARMSLCDENMSDGRKSRRVQFQMPQEDNMKIKKGQKALSSSLVKDMCSSLSTEDGADGYISDNSDSVRYFMHRVKSLSTCIPQKPLAEVLQR